MLHHIPETRFMHFCQNATTDRFIKFWANAWNCTYILPCIFITIPSGFGHTILYHYLATVFTHRSLELHIPYGHLRFYMQNFVFFYLLYKTSSQFVLVFPMQICPIVYPKVHGKPSDVHDSSNEKIGYGSQDETLLITHIPLFIPLFWHPKYREISPDSVVPIEWRRVITLFNMWKGLFYIIYNCPSFPVTSFIFQIVRLQRLRPQCI